MVVVIGKNRFGLIAQVHEELNVSCRTQHRARVKFVCIGRRSLDFADEGLSHTLTLMRRIHREQSDHADAGHSPETNGTDDPFFFCHENMFLPCIFLETLESFCGPAADCVDANIFTERDLLHLEERREVRFGGWSNVNHSVFLERGSRLS